jgi:hypothetical protein
MVLSTKREGKMLESLCSFNMEVINGQFGPQCAANLLPTLLEEF